MASTDFTSQSESQQDQQGRPASLLAQEKPQLERDIASLSKLCDHPDIPEPIRQQIMHGLQESRKMLDQTEPYTISMVGVSGAGKSTLVNALFGQHLVAFKLGTATTGTIVRVHQHTSDEALSRAWPPDAKFKSGYAQVIYHTRESLTAAVLQMCSREEATGFTPTLQDDGALDIEQTARTINDWLPSDEGGNPRQASMRLKADMRDLLTVARREEGGRFGQRQSDPIPLNDELLQLMDEKSSLNEDPHRRIIPLIQGINIHITTDASPLDNLLGQVVVTDIPGSSSGISRHDEYLIEQLQPLESDACMFVMPMAQHFLDESGQELLDRIIEMLLGSLRDNGDAVDTDAERIFIILTLGDINLGKDREEMDRVIDETLQRVTDRISPTYRQRHANNIQRVKAEPALITQLIQQYPEDGQAWLSGRRNDRFWRLQADPKHYQNCLLEAQETHPGRDETDAVLAWSGIQSLRERLRHFLGESRLERDVKTARRYYQTGRGRLYDWLQQELHHIAPELLGARGPDYLQDLRINQKSKYRAALRQSVEDILPKFQAAAGALNPDASEETSRRYLENHLHATLEQLQGQIEDFVLRPDYRQLLHHPPLDPILVRSRNQKGTVNAIRRLDNFIRDLYLERAPDIAATMMFAFRQELERLGVRNDINDLCQALPEPMAETIVDQFDTIISDIHERYEQSCRSAIFYQLVSIDLEGVILQEITDFGAMGALDSGEPLQQRLIEICDRMYKELDVQLTNGLVPLFNYHLHYPDQASDRVETLTNELRDELIRTVDRQGEEVENESYQRFMEEGQRQIRRAEALLPLWREVQRLG